MNVQVFVEPVARHPVLAAAMNAWLAEHPRIQIDREAVRIFHNHVTNADDVLVMLFYTEKPAPERKGKKVQPKAD